MFSILAVKTCFILPGNFPFKLTSYKLGRSVVRKISSMIKVYIGDYYMEGCFCAYKLFTLKIILCLPFSYFLI